MPWSNKDQIFTSFKSSGKIFKTNLDRVAQERFFYSLEEFTEEEEIILKELIELGSNEIVRPLVMEFYHLITSFSKIYRAIKNKDLSSTNSATIDKELALLLDEE